MKNLLPARLFWPSALLLLLALFARPALATHLLGGDLTYRYIDNAGPTAAPLRYELTLIVYNNCLATGTAPYPDAEIAIYERSTGAQIVMTTVNYPRLSFSNNIYIATEPLPACYQPPVLPGCVTPNTVTQPYIRQTFRALINLPNTTAGFYAVYYNSARTGDILNLVNPGGQNMQLYTTLTPPSIFNRSPTFTNTSIAVVCTQDTTYYLNNAVDADNDELEYTFGTPFSGALPSVLSFPLPTVSYPATGGYSATTPFGQGRGIVNHLNASTGVATFATPVAGKYAVAIDIKEYRVINGVRTLIGTTRRDVQLVVTPCPPSIAPKLPPPVQVPGSTAPFLPRSYTIEAGITQTIAIPVTSGTNPVMLTANSILLDGPGGYDATLNGNAGTPSGQPQVGTAAVMGTNGTLLATFVYKAGCTDVRTAPYDIALIIEDKGCGGKTVFDVFHITVVKPQGPTAIAGDAVVCGTTTSSYTASGGTTPGVTWSVTGGTIVGSPTANPVQVQWNAAGTGTLSLQGVSQGGCLTDVITKNVTISVAPALTVTGNRTICQGTSATVTVGGAVVGATYVVTGGPVSGTGTTFVLTPTATTTYTVTATSPGNSCAGTSQFTVTVSPNAAPVSAPPVAVCSGLPLQLGSAPVAGNTYSWSPTTGLSSATVANPTLTLTNATAAPITQTYTLTTTNASGCTSTTTLAVTVNPAVVATTAATATTATDTPVTLGAAPIAGFTYSWSPATGLSNANIANPTVTLPNYTGIPITRTYTLTTTNATTGCVGTATVVVTVNPDLTFEVYNNVITANGDNLNDRLKVRNIRSFPGNKVEIYNRWGRQIFSTNNYDNDTNYWGTDPILVAGNYYYIFKQGDNTIAKGWIEVVR